MNTAAPNLPQNLIELRDAAINALYSGALLRRSEIAALDVGSIGADTHGRFLALHLDQPKTDQAGDGQFVCVPRGLSLTDLLHAYISAYADHLGRTLRNDDPLFTSSHTDERLPHQAIRGVLARQAEKAGIDLQELERRRAQGRRRRQHTSGTSLDRYIA